MVDPDWAPSVADVAAYIRARTKDTNGNEAGTFNSLTRPTAAQVDALIQTASEEIAAEVGDVPDILQPVARRVAALGGALWVELTYFPEQINRNSPYEQLKERYDAALKRLSVQVGEFLSGDELGEGDVSMPSYSFPIDAGGLIGWGSRF